MASLPPSEHYPVKTLCIIGEDDEFEPLELTEDGTPQVFRRKSTLKVESSLLQSHGVDLNDRDFTSFLKQYSAVIDATLVRDISRSAGDNITQPQAELDNKMVRQDKAENQFLHVEVGDLGVVITALFAGLLALGAASSQTLIHPLIGWIGLVFGASYIGMGYADRRRMRHTHNAD